MDRRQQKTRHAIFSAFGKFLESKRFENITVQEIIDEANVGRSTFYAHFETKDELLRSLCTDIFHHVFTELLPQEADHDYSSGSKSLELKLSHILHHLVGSFAETVHWWITKDMKPQPEIVAGCYISVIIRK